jgi:hypothetical protein
MFIFNNEIIDSTQYLLQLLLDFRSLLQKVRCMTDLEISLQKYLNLEKKFIVFLLISKDASF